MKFIAAGCYEFGKYMKPEDKNESGLFLQLSAFRKHDKLELKTDISNRSLSQKLQSALEEPDHSGTKQAMLSGEHMTRLMGRKSETSCH